jgi:adenine-specific DNA-methyltransferase
MTSLAAEHHRKKGLGAFYTPPEIAAKLVQWAIRSDQDTMIDPSFGGLVFLKAARERLVELGADSTQANAQLCGVDLDEDAVRGAAREPGLDNCRLLHANFFDLAPSAGMRFSANVGNPPYVRYQSWNGSGARAHEVIADDVRLTRLASVWAPFLVHGCRFLKHEGRLAQVLPAELLHSQYAEPVVEFLKASFATVTVAVFEERVFPGALEEVILLFADGFGEGPAAGMGVVACRNVHDLELDQIDGTGRGHLDLEVPLLGLLPGRTQALYRRLMRDERMRRLGSLASVDIGVVTGANQFFMLRRGEVLKSGLDAAAFRTAISRAADIRGVRLTQADMEALDAAGQPTALLAVMSAEASGVARLVREGEKRMLHQRYKCRIRDPWYALPLPKNEPDAFLTYMSNGFPRLVSNDARALSTNTIHNVRLLNGGSPRALSVGFYNSLTLLSAELVGRSYGGGILKLEPTEAERLLIPPLPQELESHLDAVDAGIRGGELESVLDHVDALVLKPLGLSDGQMAGLRRGREKLSARRRARGSRPNGAAKKNSPATDRGSRSAG